jgi:uncharacterized lipoprotein
MKITRCCAAITLAAFSLAGCSYFSKSPIQSRDTAYISARSIPPLKIPPGVSSSSFHTEYPVSDRFYSNGDLKVSTVPPGL